MMTSAIPPPIQPTDEKSFAFLTINERLPEILVKALDYFHRSYSQFITAKYPDLDETGKIAAEEEAKHILGEFSKLRYEMMTDKQMSLLTGKKEDIPIWNQIYQSKVKELNKEPTFFSVPWLYGECFMYRKIQEVFDNSNYFQKFDSFYDQKRKALINSMQAATALGEYLTKFRVDATDLKVETIKMIEACLWGNKCDLSLTAGKECFTPANQLESMQNLRSNILINDVDKVIHTLEKMSKSSRPILDIVLDNAGFELFTDLCLVEFLHVSGLLNPDRCKVRWYVKNMPWFVSDAMKTDFHWTIDYLSKNEKSESLRNLGQKMMRYLKNGTWIIMEDLFFNLPCSYSEMESIRPTLYSTMGEADLILFKGDLNYRKLVGDLQWSNLATFKDALRGFCPSDLCALRSIKAEVCVGFHSQSQWASLPSDWMRSSDYAVIQYLTKN